jgi:hypothetical protein
MAADSCKPDIVADQVYWESFRKLRKAACFGRCLDGHHLKPFKVKAEVSFTGVISVLTLIDQDLCSLALPQSNAILFVLESMCNLRQLLGGLR